jgi:DtxR family manganese transport transcriptional regulator
LGISERIAKLDAEGIEHHVSPETLATFERLLKVRIPNASVRQRSTPAREPD